MTQPPLSYLTDGADLYHEETDTKLRCRALNINEDLGQVWIRVVTPLLTALDRLHLFGQDRHADSKQDDIPQV